MLGCGQSPLRGSFPRRAVLRPLLAESTDPRLSTLSKRRRPTSMLQFFPARISGASECSQAQLGVVILAHLKRLRRSRRSLPAQVEITKLQI